MHHNCVGFISSLLGVVSALQMAGLSLPGVNIVRRVSCVRSLIVLNLLDVVDAPLVIGQS